MRKRLINRKEVIKAHSLDRFYTKTEEGILKRSPLKGYRSNHNLNHTLISGKQHTNNHSFFEKGSLHGLSRGSFYSGKSSCSPTWYGSTDPEMDSKGESMTGRLITRYNDVALKDPCVKDCVKVHENVHVQQLKPVVEKIRKCDVEAGKDWDKKEKCNAMANRELNEPLNKWECEAYRKSFTCLTLKILDPNSPCSKSPHRKEIQKHRGYESCEMKRYCTKAGTPRAGITNV